jgi:heme exporter protein C
MWTFLYRWASPRWFYTISGRILPGLIVLTGVLLVYGLVGGLVLAPQDYQQGDGFRIIYVHVPSAFLSLMVYVVMASMSAVYLIWRIKLADILAVNSARIGASFTFLALVTGAIWGKPMWGTWWVWDARLTSELILLFLYLGYMALRNAIPKLDNAAQASGLLAIVGVINIPIIHYSVVWWNTLHQGPTLSRLAKPTIAPTMLYPLLVMIAGFICFYLVILLIQTRAELLRREHTSAWVQNIMDTHLC